MSFSLISIILSMLPWLYGRLYNKYNDSWLALKIRGQYHKTLKSIFKSKSTSSLFSCWDLNWFWKLRVICFLSYQTTKNLGLELGFVYGALTSSSAILRSASCFALGITISRLRCSWLRFPK